MLARSSKYFTKVVRRSFGAAAAAATTGLQPAQAVYVDQIKFLTNPHTENLHYDIIEPIFQWPEMNMPENPERFVIDCSGRNMKSKVLNLDLIDEMHEVFENEGIVYLTNTGLTSLQDMRSWATVILANEIVYTGGANPRKPIEPNVYDVGAPPNAWLHYHHEMAYVGKSPLFISLFCKHGMEDKGYTYVADGVAATDYVMQTPLGPKLRDLGICYIRNLTDKEFYSNKDQSMIYNHWQDSFNTTDPKVAEKLANERGLVVEWEVSAEGERFCRTKYYVSAFEYYEPLDMNILYSSMADDFMWFDSWPGIAGSDVHSRPLKLTFGDDTELTQEEKQIYVDCYDKFGFPLKWQPGDIGILCNYRWVHGRPGFTVEKEKGEKRELGVLLGETFDRIGCRSDRPYSTFEARN